MLNIKYNKFQPLLPKKKSLGTCNLGGQQLHRKKIFLSAMAAAAISSAACIQTQNNPLKKQSLQLTFDEFKQRGGF